MDPPGPPAAGVHTMNASFVLVGISSANFSSTLLQALAAGVQQQLSFADRNVNGSSWQPATLAVRTLLQAACSAARTAQPHMQPPPPPPCSGETPAMSSGQGGRALPLTVLMGQQPPAQQEQVPPATQA